MIVPCLNEEEALQTTNVRLLALLMAMEERGDTAPGSFLLYVDDGSDDATWKTIQEMAGGRVHGIRLSRHCGHQEALLAGMEYARGRCDACVTIDADLQDDIRVIPEMVERYREGAEIVFGVRDSRKSDSWFKRSSAKVFYSAMRGLGAHTVDNHADFRLLGSRAMADLMDYGERNLFLRGIVPLLGYRQESVAYERDRRKAGSSKYPLLRMVDFAINGITSFSVRPVRLLSIIGMAFILVAFCIFVYVMVRHFSGETIEGWTSLMLSIWFCTGMMLMGLGLIGEYVGKIYIEVKRRPLYRISETAGADDFIDVKDDSDELQKMELVKDLHAGE